MIHNLGQSDNRQVYLTWEIDWVPETTPARTDITRRRTCAGSTSPARPRSTRSSTPRRASTQRRRQVRLPRRGPIDPSAPGYEERSKISNARQWTVSNPNGATLVFGAGHLHPGGKNVKLMVARDGPDAGTIDGDDPSEVRDLFRSDAKYYEPAGAVSWDVAMKATPRDWRISLEQGDTVFINVVYDVHKASWYESMGILPLAWTPGHPDAAAKDPFDDAAEVQAMYDAGRRAHPPAPPGEHRRQGPQGPRPAEPAEAEEQGQRCRPRGSTSAASATCRAASPPSRGFPTGLMRPPTIESGDSVTFTNLDALPGETDDRAGLAQHHVLPPALQRRTPGSATRSPTARSSSTPASSATAPVPSTEVTTGSNVYTTPPLLYKPGKKQKKATTYTYFCRIHPLMRGSIRVLK